jgi:hypothetical protein
MKRVYYAVDIETLEIMTTDQSRVMHAYLCMVEGPKQAEIYL